MIPSVWWNILHRQSNYISDNRTIFLLSVLFWNKCNTRYHSLEEAFLQLDGRLDIPCLSHHHFVPWLFRLQIFWTPSLRHQGQEVVIRNFLVSMLILQSHIVLKQTK